MNQSNNFNDLDWGDRLLTLGYITGCFSSLLIGLGSVIRLMGELPQAPISHGLGVGGAVQSASSRQSKGYWDR
jgi:hypothetical protein